jgi:FkbM family methyltransferase
LKATQRIKAAFVNSPLEPIAQGLKWAMGAKFRHQHPEMWEVFLEGRLLTKIFDKFLKLDSNVVDVGCHIGSFISAAMKHSPNGRHILVEPTPSKCEILKLKFPKATLCRVAVSDVVGTATFEENLERSGFSRLQGPSSSADKVNCYEVQVSKLDDILTDRVDFLKIDIEGNELAALRGATAVIARDAPPILFECGSDHSMDEAGKSRRDLYDFITNDLKYSIYTFTDLLYGKEQLSFSEFQKCGIYPFRAFNFIAVKS